MTVTKRRMAQTLKKIVGRAVLLEYDHHVLKGSWEAVIPGLGRHCSKAS
jgi:hypothetical protein